MADTTPANINQTAWGSLPGVDDQDAQWIYALAQRTGKPPEDVARWYASLPASDKYMMQQQGRSAATPWGGSALDQVAQAYLKGSQGQQEGAKVQADMQRVTAEIQRFRDMLSQPIQDSYGNYKDSIAQQLAYAGQQRAQQVAGAGMRGGISPQIAQATTQSALLPYLQQRQQNLMQTDQLLNNRQMGLEQLRQGWAGIQNSQAQQQWAAQMNQAQGGAGMVGGVIGAVAGGLSPLGAAGIGPGFQVGSNLGGAWGGMNSRGGIAPQSYTQRNTSFGGSYN